MLEKMRKGLTHSLARRACERGRGLRLHDHRVLFVAACFQGSGGDRWGVFEPDYLKQTFLPQMLDALIAYKLAEGEISWR